MTSDNKKCLYLRREKLLPTQTSVQASQSISYEDMKKRNCTHPVTGGLALLKCDSNKRKREVGDRKN